MAPYFYNLAIENYADNEWYASEKLWDPLLAWCLPIYYGGSAADRLLPAGSFLRLPSLDQAGIDYIREVTATPDAWLAAQDAIAEARQVILHELICSTGCLTLSVGSKRFSWCDREIQLVRIWFTSAGGTTCLPR
jgi:hypothetical protein